MTAKQRHVDKDKSLTAIENLDTQIKLTNDKEIKDSQI